MKILLEKEEYREYYAGLLGVYDYREYYAGLTPFKVERPPYYVAPEIIRGKYDKRCDIWACGVILFIMLSGMPPVYSGSDEEILEKVEKFRIDKYFEKPYFVPREWDRVSNQAKDLVTKLLTSDYNYRISVQDALKHPWITCFNPDEVIEN